MQQVYQFFRLIRLSNILVTVLTMCLFYGLLSNYHVAPIAFDGRELILINESSPISFFETIGLHDLSFLMLMLSVAFIASAGNIINDYFDVRADRINKPNRLIIDKYIKRRWAIILNWTFNGMGAIIAFILSVRFQNWWIFGISILSINLLYFYSAIYKRKFLSGNIIVAFLTALIPLYVFIYGAFSHFGNSRPFETDNTLFLQDNLIAIIGYCSFAFLLNLIREIIKDMADVKGDLLLGSKSLPIRVGFKKTKWIITILMTIGITLLSWFILDQTFHMTNLVTINGPSLIFRILMLLVVLLMSVSLIIIITKNQTRHYLRASNLVKLAMLFGVISALFYA